MLTLGLAPPSSSTRVVNPAVDLLSDCCTALPVGVVALRALGGKIAEVSAADGAASGFPEDKIVIPVGVTPATLKNYTLYDMLGLGGEWSDSADQETIKRAYHKAVLAYHPDKQPFKTADGKEDRTVFLKIQEAYNVLSNEQKRRAYDSQLPFDESIPTEAQVEKALAKGPEKYLKMYDKVFKRNARFAVQKPVPEIGDMNTPIEQVNRFYEYWVNFESWRDFTGVGTDRKVDDGYSRYEKRYYQKEIEAAAKEAKRKEMNRLIDLVQNCMKKDPRLIREKEARKAAKEANKLSKEAEAKRKAELQTSARNWDAEQEEKAKELAKANKQDKEKLKKAQSKARNTLRKLFRATAEKGLGSGEYGLLSEEEMERICANCNLEVLNAMNDAMGGEPATKDASLLLVEGADSVRRLLEEAVSSTSQAEDDERIAKEARKRELEERSAPDRKKKPEVRDWTASDNEVLERSLRRYPAGFPNRWVSVANYLNDQLKPEYSFDAEECLIAAYLMSAGSS